MNLVHRALLEPINEAISRLETVLQAELSRTGRSCYGLTRNSMGQVAVGCCGLLLLVSTIVAGVVDKSGVSVQSIIGPILFILCAAVNLAHGCREQRLYASERLWQLESVLVQTRAGIAAPILGCRLDEGKFHGAWPHGPRPRPSNSLIRGVGGGGGTCRAASCDRGPQTA